MNIRFSRKWINFVKGLHALSNKSKLTMGIVIGLLFLSHITLSLCLKDFAWLAAFGALLSIFGLLISFSYSLSLSDIDKKDLEPTKEGEHYIFGGSSMGEVITNTEDIERIKVSSVKNILEDYKNISVYIVFTIVGTLVWAYAGFLNAIFLRSCA